MKKVFKPLFLTVVIAMAGAGMTEDARAVSPSVVISQVYGGGGNTGAPLTHDFIELFNRGTTTVSLAGWSIQYASATGTGNFGVTNQITLLSGSIAPGQYFLIQEAGAATPSTLPTPDLISSPSIAMAAGAAKVALVNSVTPLGCNGGSTPCLTTATIVDLVGWGNANFFEGTVGPTTSNTTAALRAGLGCQDTDNNGADFAAGPPMPRNTASPIVSSCVVADLAPTISSTQPVNGAADFPLTGNLTVTFSEAVNVTASAFELSCTGAGAVAVAVSGGPSSTFTLGPATALTHGDNCTLTVRAAEVTDLDSSDPPNTMAADYATSFTPFENCSAPYTPISTIQGNGAATPIPGVVSTKGVVVGDFEGSTGLQGFYLQDPVGDGNPATSDGIFVFTGTANTVSEGQVVRVTGFARERFNQTTLNGSNSNTAAVTGANIAGCGSGSVTPVDVSLPFDAADYPERYEGMLVRLPQALVISEYFNFERFGEMVLALPLPGEERIFTGTAIDAPGAPAVARSAANKLSRITLDDGLGIQNPDFLRHPNGNAFTLINRFRGGDTVTNTIGVLGFDFDLYRIQPTGPAQYTETNPRVQEPAPVGGQLRVASMNTLNFFLTQDPPPGPLDNKCGPFQNVECRGADADQPAEFTRQRDKLLAALAGLDADIIGLNELENTTGVDPLGHPTSGIVAGLNSMPDVGPYSYIATGAIGTDAIRVGFIYRTTTVRPIGDFKILTTAVDPRFLDTRNRPALAQTFEHIPTLARFTAVANHLKSKGSDCDDIGDADLLDGQGNCSQTRRRAAEALMDWLATDPTGSGDADYLILGDLNSYSREHSISAILAGADDVADTVDDYTNLIAKFAGKYAYSYVFDGESGYLDHALSFATLTPQVTGATEWHINADESDVLDYDTSFKPPSQEGIYAADAFRSSDHDAVLVGLNPLHYNFTGFFSPVSETPVFPMFNNAKAGSSIPVKFSLGGFQGLDVFANGHPAVREIECSSGEFAQLPVSLSGQISYEENSDQYLYHWKTEKAWEGRCQQLVVILRDGSIHTANFSFKP